MYTLLNDNSIKTIYNMKLKWYKVEVHYRLLEIQLTCKKHSRILKSTTCT